MKTDDFIELLSVDAQPITGDFVLRRIGFAVVLGGVLTFGIVALWLGCQPLAQAARQPWFWVKAAYTALLVLPAAAMSARLARPGGRIRWAPSAVFVIAAAMVALAVVQLLLTPPDGRVAVWLGQSWRVCSPLILLLSIPTYAALVIALRTLAPTRLTSAGAAAGFLSGALAATIYGLHCPEQGAAFVTTWYSLGIVGATVLGAATGRSLLRW